MVLMYSPSVYNQSCQWPTVVSFLVNKNNVSSEWSAGHQLLDSTTTTPQPALQLTGYDVFRCAVVLIVTCGLIGGNLILALAVNGKYSIGILQFQVYSVSHTNPFINEGVLYIRLIDFYQRISKFSQGSINKSCTRSNPI